MHPFPSASASGLRGHEASRTLVDPLYSTFQPSPGNDLGESENPPPHPGYFNVLPPEVSQLYWRQLDLMRQGTLRPSQHVPYDLPNMPQISLMQSEPLTTSWDRDVKGEWFYARRARLEEVLDEDASLGLATPTSKASLGPLSPTATPPPPPVPKKLALHISTSIPASPVALAPSARTFAQSILLRPIEPNLQEANQRLTAHVRRSTGYIRTSSLGGGLFSGQNENGHLLSPLTATSTAGGWLLRREHPLQKSFTASELGTLLVGDQPMSHPKLVARQPLSDIPTNEPGSPPQPSPTETTAEAMRQAHAGADHDMDQLDAGEITTRRPGSRETLENVQDPPPRAPLGPVHQIRMPSLRRYQSRASLNAPTELIETASSSLSIRPSSAESLPAQPGRRTETQRSLSLSSSGRGSFSTDHRIPHSSTPPPPFRLRRRQPFGSTGGRTKEAFPFSSRHNVPRPPGPAPPAGPSSHASTPAGEGVPTADAELLAIITQMILAALKGVDRVRMFFMRVGHLHDVLKHTEMCHGVKTSLTALLSTLQRRRRLNEEHMRLGTQGWHRKYVERLGSSHRTLQKLIEFSVLVGSYQEPKLSLLDRVLVKLTEYESKIMNLAAKFNALFDRLRVRHLHELLTKEHAAAVAARHGVGVTEDVKAWAEGKVRRAQLRRELEAYRSGRRTSLCSAA